MGNLYAFRNDLGTARRYRHATYFNRAELNLLLSLYSRRVASGEWRDYAIDQDADMAIFSVFRHTLDQPIFTIAKRAGKPGREPGRDLGRNEEFLVFSGRERLARAGRLAEALSIFQRKLKIVS